MIENVLNLIKNKEIKKIINQYTNNIYIEKFNIQINEIEHKNYMLVGTAIDYIIRKELYILLNKFPLNEKLICEKSLNLLENLLFEENFEKYKKWIRKKIWNFKNEKNFNYEDILILSRMDSFYRSNFFDKNIFRKQNLHVIKDIKNLHTNFKNNLIKELFLEKKENKIILNPIFGKKIGQSLIKADGDIIINDSIIEIKTTINNKIKKEWLHQVIIYFILYENFDEIKYIKFINPRADNIIKIKISDLITNYNKLKDQLIFFIKNN